MRLPLLPISLLCLVLVAGACGSNTSPTRSAPLTSPTTSAGTSVAPGRSSAPGDPAVVGPSAPSSDRPTRANCGDISDAWRLTREQLDLLSALTDDETWAAARKPESQLTLDPDALARAIDLLSTLPGQSDTIDLVRQVVPLYRAALKSPAPFADASNVGPRLLELAQNADAIAKVEIQNAIEVAGCDIQS